MNLIRFGALTCALALCLQPLAANAWSAAGHRMITLAAVEALPATMPGFLRAPDSVDALAVIAAEPENMRGAGTSADRDGEAAGFVRLGDDGRVAGSVALSPLPEDREAYDTALRRAGSDQYKAGYLPYAIVDGFQRVRRDFAYWRVLQVLSQNAKDTNDKNYFSNLRWLREQLTLRDIGIWSSAVADGSQPLRTSMHYDGWERYPNSKGVFGHFDVTFVDQAIKAPMIKPRMRAFTACNCTIEAETAKYLAATNGQVERLYQLNSLGAFDAPTDAGARFVVDRMATGASELRDLLVEAWAQSDDATIGNPAIKVKDVESGAVVPTRAAVGGG